MTSIIPKSKIIDLIEKDLENAASACYHNKPVQAYELIWKCHGLLQKLREKKQQ